MASMAVMNNVASPFSASSFLPLVSHCSVPYTLAPFPAKYAKVCSLVVAYRPNVLTRRCAGSRNENHGESVDDAAQDNEDERKETIMYSFTPLPLLFVAALPGATFDAVHAFPAATVRSLFGPFVEIVKSLSLPEWLVHWGHPGNMAVVLFAMGGYGTYLGFRIRFTDDLKERAKAKDLHPKLLGGMFFFFALGATGGITSLLTSDKPIFESPHAVTGFIGLALLTIQSILPALFEGNNGLRNIHGILGSGIMTLFLVHAALGLQLGLNS